MNSPKHCLKPEFPEAVVYMISAADLEHILRNLINDLISEREEVKKETYISASQVSNLLGVSKSTLWRWEKENYLVPVRVGNKLRYKESEVKQLMEGK